MDNPPWPRQSGFDRRGTACHRQIRIEPPAAANRVRGDSLPITLRYEIPLLPPAPDPPFGAAVRFVACLMLPAQIRSFCTAISEAPNFGADQANDSHRSPPPPDSACWSDGRYLAPSRQPLQQPRTAPSRVAAGCLDSRMAWTTS